MSFVQSSDIRGRVGGKRMESGTRLVGTERN